MAQRFDADRLRLRGEAYSVDRSCARNTADWPHVCDAVPRWLGLYRVQPTQFTWLDQSGQAEERSARPATTRVLPCRSMVGEWWHRARPARARDLWLVDAERNVSSRFTLNQD